MLLRLSFAFICSALLLGGCQNLQVATGDYIVGGGPPGTPGVPLQSDADRQAVYNQSGEGIVPAATPRTAPLNEQVSEINSRKLPEMPSNRSPNITPEQRSREQIPQPAMLPPPGPPQ
jgi:hypothetical protein